MKLPTLCPFCKRVLVTQFINNNGFDTNFFTKTCETNPHHKLEFKAKSEKCGDKVFSMRMTIAFRKWAIWTDNELGEKWFRIWEEGTNNNLYLPYFEPNMSDYNKLLEKIKLYTLMS